MVFRAVQPLNAFSPIFLMPAGNSTVSKAVQFLKALSTIISAAPLITTDFKWRQSLKHKYSKFSTNIRYPPLLNDVKTLII
jgi:hypothetical protein